MYGDAAATAEAWCARCNGRCAQSHRAPRAELVVSPHMSFAPKLRPEVAAQWPDLAHIDGEHGVMAVGIRISNSSTVKSRATAGLRTQISVHAQWCSCGAASRALGRRWLQAPRGSRPFAGTTRRGSGAWYRFAPIGAICDASSQGTGLAPTPSEQVTCLRGDWGVSWLPPRAIPSGLSGLTSATGRGHCAGRVVRWCNKLSGVATGCPMSCFSWRTWAGSPARRSCSTRGALKPRPSGLGFMFGPAADAAAGHGSAGRCVLRSRRSDQAAQRRAFLLAALPTSPGQRRYARSRWTHLICSLNVRGKPILNSATAAVQVTAQAASGSGGPHAAARHAGASRAGALRRRIPNRQLLLWED
jgi:hypothetical protein